MSDRELDALVAEKVMGWCRWEPDDGDLECECPGVHFADFGDGAVCVYPPGSDDASRLFDPMGDIADAWEVVNQMRELGWHIDLDNDGSHKIGAEESWTWNALLWTDRDDYDGDGDGDWPTAHADTAPRAICLAALRAVGVEVES